MADTKISALVALLGSNAAADDEFVIVDKSATATKKITLGALATALLGSGALNGATVTANAPVGNFTQTWNNAAEVFTGFKLNITDSASNAASLLMDLQKGGISQFSVSKGGTVTIGPDAILNFSSSVNQLYLSGGAFTFKAGGAQIFTLSNNSLTFGTDALLTRKGAANLRLGAADAATPVAQTLSVQGRTGTDAAATAYPFTIQGAQGTGTGAGGSIVFQVAPAGLTGSTPNGFATVFQIGDINVPRSFTLKSATTDFMFTTGVNGASPNGQLTITAGGQGAGYITSAGIFAGGGKSLGFAGSVGDVNTAPDVYLYRDAANTLALRNGAAAQESRVYNTTDGTNSEFVSLSWQRVTNRFSLGTTKAGTGTARDVELYAGDTGAQIFMETNGTTTIGKRGSSFFWVVQGATGHLVAGGDNVYDIGAAAATRPRNLFLGSYMQMSEMTAPAAPAANGVRIYAEDDGAGKTRLMARFATGAAQQIAIEP